jgi:hypothetical protein
MMRTERSRGSDGGGTALERRLHAFGEPGRLEKPMSDNLEQHRSEPSVWERGPRLDVERWIAAAAAGGCVGVGLRRGSSAGLSLVIAGAGLALWAASNVETRREWRAILARCWPSRRQQQEAAIDEASRESFPASDAPAIGPRASR